MSRAQNKGSNDNYALKTREVTIPNASVDQDTSEELPVINIVLNPDDPQSINGLAVSVPLFVKKLWKIVNDEKNEAIITWNKTGDSFIIQDQLKFLSETLPKYFKHNQLSSFVRQLNLYDFHKIQPLEKDLFQFGHPFFLKDLPQLLPLIKRKSPSGRQKKAATSSENTNETLSAPQQSIVEEMIEVVKDIKTKNDVISSDMAKLRQENAALWGEMNSLRLKYSKQSKIINKLIHFLIAYMQKHHNSRKSGRTVSATNSNKYLKTGPRIMELDYKYKNNPHEFWSDFDSQENIPDHGEQEPYTVVEPAESHNEDAQTENSPSNMTMSTNIEELIPNYDTFSQVNESQTSPNLPSFDCNQNRPSSSKASSSNSALQRSMSGNKNLGYLIDNSRVEINSIKELLKNLTPDDMTNFYKLVNENYKDQEDDLNLDVDNELMSLSQISSLSESPDSTTEKNVGAINDSIDKQAFVASPAYFFDVDEGNVKANVATTTSPLDSLDKNSPVDIPTPALPFEELIQVQNQLDDNNINLTEDDLLNPNIFNNVSVDQLFNID